MAPSTPIVSTDQRRQLPRSAVIAQGQETIAPHSPVFGPSGAVVLRLSRAHASRLSREPRPHLRMSSWMLRGGLQDIRHGGRQLIPARR